MSTTLKRDFSVLIANTDVLALWLKKAYWLESRLMKIAAQHKIAYAERIGQIAFVIY